MPFGGDTILLEGSYLHSIILAPTICVLKNYSNASIRRKITEIIFALPADVEGESTTNYIVDLLKNKPVDLTRIARGIPAGGGLNRQMS